jgi:hypothetical protein
MAHKVHMRLPKEQIMNSDVEFVVKRGSTKLGELHISKGNVEWWPAGNRRKKYRLRWTQVAALFEEEGRLVKE